MRLLRLLPDQIMTYWPEIKVKIREALPPITRDSDDAMLRIQEHMLVGSMQCWVAVDDEDINHFYAIMTTKVSVDECAGSRSLLIYTLTTLGPHPNSLWEDGYREMAKFAKANDCYQIIAYTNQPALMMLTRSLGGDTSWSLLLFPI